MTRVRSSLVLAMVFVLGGVLLASAAQAAEGRAGGARRGSRTMGRGSLLGLLRSKQVQKELKLTEEQTGKVTEVSKKLMEEMRKQSAALQEITDREQRQAKRTELSNQLDRKAREQLRDVLSREQIMRLYQIRTQVRGVVATLGNEFVARRLKLTDEQKKKVAEIAQSTQQKQRELYAGLRGADQEARGKAMGKLRELRQKADQEALAVLTAEQKEGFKKMQGEKFELQMRRRPQ